MLLLVFAIACVLAGALVWVLELVMRLHTLRGIVTRSMRDDGRLGGRTGDVVGGRGRGEAAAHKGGR